MAISHVNTSSQTTGNGTSVSVSKPGGTTSGDLLLAFFTSNSQECTPPSGFTEIDDNVNEVFRSQIFYKVAGGSEPASYSFSVPSSCPLVASVTCLRGVNTSSPIDIAPVADTDLTHSEPYTTPTVSGGTSGVLVYHRTVRVSGSTPATFTGAAGATERVDVGVFSGGSVCYSQGTYVSTTEYATSGSKSGLAITASQSESHNVVVTLGVKASGIPGTMDVDLPSIPTMTASGSVAYPAVVDVDLHPPTMTVEAFHGSYEGPLDVQVPVTVTLAGHTDVRGSLDVEVPISFDTFAETRRFADNVVVPDREERWLVMTQDGYRLGIRDVRHIPLVVMLPELQVEFFGTTAPLAGENFVTAEAFEPTVVAFAPGAAETANDVYSDVFDAEVWLGIVVYPEHVSVLGETDGVDQLDIGVTTEPSEASAAVVAFDPSRGVGQANVEVSVYGVSLARTAKPNAELVSVSATADQPQFTGGATATATANNATVQQSTSAFAETVFVTCIQ